MWIVYMVECAETSLHKGITNNLEQRMGVHATGKGTKYTKSRGPVTLHYTEILNSKGAALRRESAIKALDCSAKLALSSTDNG
ncbi:MAG: hypothetical protein OJF50_006378 [Nitrospira sp.]|jgi:putative endonuclease|nr:hypothetical protein [Nitrospira sp.]